MRDLLSDFNNYSWPAKPAVWWGRTSRLRAINFCL